MIRVEKSPDGRSAAVAGSECEVMLFYCFWQSELWPEWMVHPKLGEDSDSATRQHKWAIECINSGNTLLLQHTSEQFELALQFAIDRCLLLGIQIDKD